MPEQTLRLVGRLNEMFGEPPITCHHDFSQCALCREQFPGNVSFVMPSQRTEWGRFSLLESGLRAIRALYEGASGPDWFIFLSGSDYPIKPAAEIRRELAASPYDAHIHHELICENRFERDWQRLCFRRYFTGHKDVSLPFSDQFRCYAGESFFCANYRAA